MPSQAAYQVELQAPAPLESILKDFLDLSRYQDRDDISEEQLRYLIDTAPAQVTQLSSTEGYFSPITKIALEETDPKRRVVRISIDPGPLTHISDVLIGLTGAAQQDDPEQQQTIRKKWPLASGAPFRQEDWDNAKNSSLQALQTQRYAAARIARSEARIDPEQQSARLEVDFDSGPAFTLGPLEITGLRRYPASIIRNVSPLLPGETYSQARLLALQRQIQSTPYFSNVIVGIDDDPAHAENAPVKVQVSEFPTQRIRTGVGYSTDTGASVDARYTHYNVFDRAWVFDSQIKLEQKRQFESINLAMPPDSKSFVNSVGITNDRTTLEGVDLRSLVLDLRRARSFEFYDTAYTLDYYRDELRQTNGAALPANTVITPGLHQALAPGFSWSRRAVDDPIFPRSGHLLSAQVAVALQGILTDQSFARLFLRYKYFIPVAHRDVIILRTDMGGVVTRGSASAVPASLLFRAGGTDSVRGYSYQSIGNEQNGTVYPTKYMLTGSAEYQHWLTAQWGGALFYDVGTATDSIEKRSVYQGIGTGARYRSPVGTINLDLAYGITQRQFRPHISLGIAF
ncbi:autotransporter assembly complex family protein [Herbaspirillum sp. RTI4]|nr:autotransporter assembly complex family protein [Herbaspirillum sp. RTI4]MDY7579811.1 autotransporter assembly complex family protein [Herbaspirillum sp. RTI4]MEA9982584.1 autotransporter assembly complex family protein [Herbaspirillum sp. RTI4]